MTPSTINTPTMSTITPAIRVIGVLARFGAPPANHPSAVSARAGSPSATKPTRNMVARIAESTRFTQIREIAVMQELLAQLMAERLEN